MTGNQTPRICVEPHRVSTDGTDAVFLIAEYGYKLDPWQENIINSWLSKDELNNYIVTSAGLALPRQNGKNVCLETREFFGLVILGEKILHTAHQVRTSKKSFRRLAQLFTDKRHPEIMELVKSIRYTNGEEAIELWNGGMIEFSARSRQAARGFDGISLVVYDEAQELTDDQVEAIMSTLSASATGSRQIIYTGTPPYPGCPGEVFRRRRTVCIENSGDHDAWHEWSAEGENIDSINIEDKALWYETNPALGYRLTEEFTEEEKRTMSKDGFARERLGWWSPLLTEKNEKAINEEAWTACKSTNKKPEGKTAYGVKFSPDGAEVILCGAVISENGARISQIERRTTDSGIQWLADWLNERYSKASCVVIDGRNGVDILIDKITETWRLKNSIIRANSNDTIAAASLLINEINEKTVTWYALQEDLDDSAKNSIKRKIGGGFGFGGANSLPIEGCSFALWGARNSRRDPSRKMRIG